MSAPDVGQMSRAHTYVLAQRLRLAYVLDVPCVYCGAIPGVWCRTASGKRAPGLHGLRCELSFAPDAAGALVRYVSQFGWRFADRRGSS